LAMTADKNINQRNKQFGEEHIYLAFQVVYNRSKLDVSGLQRVWKLVMFGILVYASPELAFVAKH